MITIKQFTFSPIQENTYVLYNEAKDALIIDPGCYFSNEENELTAFITDNNLKPVQLLNTHCHLDHVFGNKFIAKQYGLELYLHPKEEKMLQMAPQSGKMYGLDFDNYAGPLHFINDGDVIFLGDDKLQVLLTPGHSPGSVCFYNENQQFVIGGDVLFYESIGRTDLPFGDHQTLLNSIVQKLYVLPDEVKVYNGHGPATTIGHEKKHNPFISI